MDELFPRSMHKIDFCNASLDYMEKLQEMIAPSESLPPPWEDNRLKDWSVKVPLM